MDNMRRSASDKNLRRPEGCRSSSTADPQEESFASSAQKQGFSAQCWLRGTLTFKRGGSYKDAMSKDLSKKLSSRDRLSPGMNEPPRTAQTPPKRAPKPPLEVRRRRRSRCTRRRGGHQTFAFCRGKWVEPSARQNERCRI